MHKIARIIDRALTFVLAPVTRSRGLMSWMSIALVAGALAACSDSSTAPKAAAPKKWIMAITDDRAFTDGGANIIVSKTSVYNRDPVVGYGAWNGVIAYEQLDTTETATITHSVINEDLSVNKVGMLVSMTQSGNALRMVGNVASVYEAVFDGWGMDARYIGDTTFVGRGPLSSLEQFNLLAGALKGQNIHSMLAMNVGVEVGCQSTGTSFISSDDPTFSFQWRNGSNDTYGWQSTHIIKVDCYEADMAPASVLAAMRAQQQVKLSLDRSSGKLQYSKM